MAEVRVADQSAEQRLEAETLDEVRHTLETIERLQRIFLPQLEQKGELAQAAGRRCFLAIEGLKYHKWAEYFEVTATGVRTVPAFANYDTAIVASLDSVLRVLKGVLAGNEHVFSEEWARGQARIIGDRKLHDGYVFNEVFGRLARIIRRYRTGGKG